jgi:hypothetical protein
MTCLSVGSQKIFLDQLYTGSWLCFRERYQRENLQLLHELQLKNLKIITNYLGCTT